MSDTTWIGGLSVMDYVQTLHNRESSTISSRAKDQTDALAATQNDYQSTVNTEQALQGLLTTLQQNITGLKNAFNASYQAASSNTTVATVQLIEGATTSPGTHVLNVTQLAQAKTVASATQFSSATNALNINNGDVLTIQVGSSSFNVPIQATDSLNNIAKNINIGAAANNVGAIASVMQTGTNQFRLVVSSTQTGTANEVNITESQSDLGITTGTGVVMTQARNAQFTLDYVDGSNPGISFDQATNTANINGLAVNLLSAQAGAAGQGLSTTITVTSSNNIANVSSAAQKVVDSWNKVMNSVAQAQAGSKYDPNLRLVQDTLLTTMRANANVLSQVGITATPYNEITPITTTVDQDSGQMPVKYLPTGLLDFDADKMTEALTDNFAGMQISLTGTGSVFSGVSDAIGDSSGAFSGTLQYALKQTITTDSAQISSIKDQIQKIQADTKKQIEGLAKKYGAIALSMSNLQTTSQYLTQQIAQNNK